MTSHNTPHLIEAKAARAIGSQRFPSTRKNKIPDKLGSLVSVPKRPKLGPTGTSCPALTSLGSLANFPRSARQLRSSISNGDKHSAKSPPQKNKKDPGFERIKGLVPAKVQDPGSETPKINKACKKIKKIHA